MNNWYEVSIRYEKTMDNGAVKKVTEKYLCDALSLTESEARIIEEMTPFISGEFWVKSSKYSKYTEVFASNEERDDMWFKCQISYISIDEKTGREKRMPMNVLVQACDLRMAVNNLDEAMKGTMADYIIDSVSDSKILDVYPYEGKESNHA